MAINKTILCGKGIAALLAAAFRTLNCFKDAVFAIQNTAVKNPTVYRDFNPAGLLTFNANNNNKIPQTLIHGKRLTTRKTTCNNFSEKKEQFLKIGKPRCG